MNVKINVYCADLIFLNVCFLFWRMYIQLYCFVFIIFQFLLNLNSGIRPVSVISARLLWLYFPPPHFAKKLTYVKMWRIVKRAQSQVLCNSNYRIFHSTTKPFCFLYLTFLDLVWIVINEVERTSASKKGTSM